MRVLLIGFFALALIHCGPACENEISEDLPSPDGNHRIVVFSRSCGVTTGLNTQATILGKGERLSNKEGNAFIIDSGTAKVSWKSDGKLLVTLDPSVRIFKQQNSAGGVEIEYQR
jgi:hypothetical protein